MKAAAAAEERSSGKRWVGVVLGCALALSAVGLQGCGRQAPPPPDPGPPEEPKEVSRSEEKAMAKSGETKKASEAIAKIEHDQEMSEGQQAVACDATLTSEGETFVSALKEKAPKAVELFKEENLKGLTELCTAVTMVMNKVLLEEGQAGKQFTPKETDSIYHATFDNEKETHAEQFKKTVHDTMKDPASRKSWLTQMKPYGVDQLNDQEILDYYDGIAEQQIPRVEGILAVQGCIRHFWNLKCNAHSEAHIAEVAEKTEANDAHGAEAEASASEEAEASASQEATAEQTEEDEGTDEATAEKNKKGEATDEAEAPASEEATAEKNKEDNETDEAPVGRKRPSTKASLIEGLVSARELVVGASKAQRGVGGRRWSKRPAVLGNLADSEVLELRTRRQAAVSILPSAGGD